MMDLGTLKPTKGSISSSSGLGEEMDLGREELRVKVIKGTNPVRVLKIGFTLKVDKLL